MHQTEPLEKKLNPFEIIKESLLFYKTYFPLLFLISLLTYSISLFEQICATLGIPIGVLGLFTLFGSIIVSFWGYIALIFAASEKHSQRDITVKEAFLGTPDKIWKVMCVSTFCGFLVICGFLLCVVPGVYWGVIFGLAVLLAILEDRSFFESFKRSKKLVSGYFWPILLLGCCMLLISLPIYAVLFANIPAKIKIFSMLFITILYNPFGVAVTVNLYYRLRKLQADVEPSPEEETKKGAGCLGCLAGVGLFIAMIILSTFWIRGLVGFVKTDTGNKYYEWVAKKVSPKIVFPGNVTLNRPEGYLVLESTPSRYSFYGFKDKNVLVFNAFSIPLKDLGITDKASVSLGEGVVWDKYFEYFTKQSPLKEQTLSSYEQDSVKTMMINDKKWVEVTLSEKEKEYSKSEKVWVSVYTLVDNDVVFFTYGFNGKKDPSPDHNLELERILEGMNFTN